MPRAPSPTPTRQPFDRLRTAKSPYPLASRERRGCLKAKGDVHLLILEKARAWKIGSTRHCCNADDAKCQRAVPASADWSKRRSQTKSYIARPVSSLSREINDFVHAETQRFGFWKMVDAKDLELTLGMMW